jgi:hypothetical protein
MSMGFQIIFSALIFMAVIRLCVQFRKKNIKPFFFFFFISVWVLVLFLNWNKPFLKMIGHLLGIERGAAILVYFGFFLVFYYIFVSLIKFYKIEQDINKLITKEAVNDFLKRYQARDK